MKTKIIAFLLSFALSTSAFAGTTTFQATPGTGGPFKFGTDGSSNLFGNGAICDGAACALLASVNAAGTPGANGLAVQGLTNGVPFPVIQPTASLLNMTEVNSAAILAAAQAPISNTSFGATSSPAITNPTSTLTLTSATTAYTAGQLIANNATAGSITVPSFAIANSAGGALISRLRLTTNDNTTTAWPNVVVQVDLWLAAPTFSTGDRTTWTIATGTANHFGSFSCAMSPEYGDGAYAECAPTVGSVVTPKLASGTSVFWTLKAVGASGVTGASKVFTLTAETLN